MTFSNSNSWAQALSYDQKKTFHLVMQVAGSALAISGSVIRIQGYSGDAFGTGHGIFGLLALIFTVISLIGGVINLYIKKKGNIIKIGHALVGCATLILAFVTLIMGMDKDIFRIYVASSGANTLIALAVISLIGVMFPACFGVYRRIIN
ncbi:hypothetical protein EVAR_81079_1 [Eumeta japonica]|uniref:ascorbate ferrireductase (transmembrane) n=1 Tax=Eumeta variegata TaxID=151549 RepID=A0A4C1T8S2_EUMVA|nr:hypothetical protein EVAR_81079_1 [Eumeta japonica]